MDVEGKEFSGEDSSDDSEGWISWFCDLEGHEFFIEVRKQYDSTPLIHYRSMRTTSAILSISMASNRKSKTISKIPFIWQRSNENDSE
jgi:hypothetical protein